MKKLIVLMMAAVMVIGVSACKSSGGSSDFNWTRTGTYDDGNKNFLIITKPDDGEHEGQWAVSVLLANGEVHAWFLEQKGETLAGNLNSEVDDSDTDYVVTVSEEGEDGLKMEVEGGETYHFKEADLSGNASVLKINTEGLGSVAYGPEGSKVEFNNEAPTQSATENVASPTKYVIKAKPDEGWKFAKWTKDGKDFSTDAEITVEVSADVEYIAVFEEE